MTASAARFDVAGIGNAIVDILAPCEEAFLDQWKIERHSMTLIDEARAEALTAAAHAPVITSGGSGANTIAGVASFGGRGAYLGKVANDALGAQFTDEIQKEGVQFHTVPLNGGAATARCIIFVSADGSRSMNTFLGASTYFSPADLNADIIRDSAVTYLEGYLFDKDDAKKAFVRAAEIARAAGRKVSLTLSDSFCVDRHRDSFRHLVKGHIDILFANEAELLSLYETQSFDDAIRQLGAEVELAAVTRSEKGSVVVARGMASAVSAVPVDRVVDTTGAGDQYAAGFLYGYARGASPEACATLGHIAAGEVIGHFGPRPQQSYAALARLQNVMK
jgi:sugar/nucleoside kinase (ribokinase family)